MFLLLAGYASAAGYCGDRGKIVGQLQDKYEETRMGLGLTDNGKVLEVFTSKAGTWTIVATGPDGTMCLIATGEAWEDVKPSLGNPTSYQE